MVALCPAGAALAAFCKLGCRRATCAVHPNSPPAQLLSSGKIIFHGPRELVLPFFESLGFACPPRKGIAEYLQGGAHAGG